MPTHEFPILYDHQKRLWKIYISVDKQGRGFIGKEFGIKGGKISRPSPREITYKTTPSPSDMYKRLYKLAETRWRNKKRSGFDTKIPKIAAVSPMLAYDYTKYSHRIVFPAYVQIKYDGYRALTDLRQNILLSRRMNKLQHVDHITQELAQIHGNGIYLDGELYLSEGLFELKTAMATDKAPRPFYYVFDMFDLNEMDMGFQDRLAKLKALFKKGKYHYVKLVETYPVRNATDIRRYMSKFLKSGHEGLIVRNAQGEYKLRGRSMDVQKLIEVKHGYFPIVGFKTGEGQQVIWELGCHKGQRTFYASPMGTHAYRKELLKNASQYIGQRVLVKYFDIDPDGCVTRNPIVVM